MRMVDLITRKKRGGELTADEIRWLVDGFVKGDIPDEQISAFLMAVWFRGMTDRETVELTLAMRDSGDIVNLSAIPGVKVDKHSTGGVGDKTTLIVLPIFAACGGVAAKMSGRGLGHTGGTIDKLESIPGFQTSLSEAAFFEAVKREGLAVIGQSAELAPADKKLYALRDVTATVDSIPLIASSVMSKKLAAGADAILLDVTVGSGAFMKEVSDALKLAQTMVAIGEGAGKRTMALLTDMDAPLGRAVGNAIEVAEAVQVLTGEGPEDLKAVSLALAAGMLELSGQGSHDTCTEKAAKALSDGAAFDVFCRMVTAQGGDISAVRDTRKLPRAAFTEPVRAVSGGYITHIDAEKIGTAAMMLGAGREKQGDQIDMAAGIYLKRKPGEYACKGDEMALLLTNEQERFAAAQGVLNDAFQIGENPPEERPLVLARVMKEQTEVYSPDGI